MKRQTFLQTTIQILILGLIACGVLPGQTVVADSSVPSIQPATSSDPQPAVADSQNIFIPVVQQNYPWISPFGVESNRSWKSNNPYVGLAQDLQVGWARLGNNRVSWRKLQPVEGGPIQWETLAGFELELQSLKSAGMKVVVVINDSPVWATNNDVRDDGLPTSCGPIQAEKFSAYAEFLRQLVERYKTPEFDVHHWELGNEPDVDPNLVEPNYGFGCWGDIDDPYYGGEHYGEMLKVVTPVIKAEDPSAKVWIGGLLLDSPNTTAEGKGKPELFLKGILEAGAAPYFDVLPYHWYPPYLNQPMDYDTQIGLWSEMGGGTIGKARFLRGIMAEYGVDKPLFLNETSLMCPEVVSGQPISWCNPPSPEFFTRQAIHSVRALVRGFSEKVSGFIWYTLNGPGWRYTGLLDENTIPKPVYTAYQQLNLQLQNTRYIGAEGLGEGIESYTFRRGKQVVHIVWAVENTTLSISFPKSQFSAAYDLNGNAITPTDAGSSYQISVGFAPVYVITKW